MKRLILFTVVITTIALSPLFLTIAGLADGSFACDLAGQIIPFIDETRRMLGSGAPFWSWNTLLGDNFIGAYAYYTVGNPFALACCLFPERFTWAGIILMLYLVNLLNALSARTFFRTLRLDDGKAFVGALMYSLCPFCLANQFYFIFAIGTITLPLFLTLVEKLQSAKRKSFLLLALLSCFTVMANFYCGALNFIITGLYALIGMKYDFLRQRASNTGLVCLAICLGILMAAVLFVPAVASVAGNSRNGIYGFGDNIFGLTVIALKRLALLVTPTFSEGGLNSFSESFCSAHLYVPVTGCSLAALYVVRHPKSPLTWLLAVLMVILLTPLNSIFAFGANNSYIRWGYALDLFIIVASLRLLDEPFALRRRPFVVYTVCAMALVALPFVVDKVYSLPVTDTDIRICVLFVVGIATLWLAVLTSFRLKVLTWCVVGMGTFGYLAFIDSISNLDEAASLDNIYYVSDYMGSKREIGPIVREKDSFERVHLKTIYTNWGLLENLPDIQTFHSAQNKALMDFKKSYTGPASPRFIPSHHLESALSMLSVGWIGLKGDTDLSSTILPAACNRPDFVTADMSFYRNPNFIPMGFTYTEYLPEEEVLPVTDEMLEMITDITAKGHTLSDDLLPDITLRMLSGVVLGADDAAELSDLVTRQTLPAEKLSLDSLAAARKQGAMENFVATTRGFTATAPAASEDRLVFFSIPADPGWSVTIDGTPAKIYRANLGMMALRVPAGRHLIEGKYFTPGLKTGIVISILGWLIFFVVSFVYRRKPKKNF